MGAKFVLHHKKVMGGYEMECFGTHSGLSEKMMEEQIWVEAKMVVVCACEKLRTARRLEISNA